MWAILALSSAACFGIVSVIDKRLLDHHLPSVSVLFLWIAIVLSFYLVIVLAVIGIPQDPPVDALLMGLASGLSTGAGLALMFAGLKQDEASRAIAITQINPIFVALLAVLFLGETLAPMQWGAILLAVMGTMLISLRELPDRKALRPTRGTPLLLGSGLGLGVGIFTVKAALESLSVWEVFVIQQLGVVLVFLLLSRPAAWRQLFSILRSRNTLLLLLLGEGMLPILAILLSLVATSMGPVSVVAAFLATRPLFVFVVSTVLSHPRWGLTEESLTRRDLALKVVSIVMIVAGVGVLGFS